MSRGLFRVQLFYCSLKSVGSVMNIHVGILSLTLDKFQPALMLATCFQR